MSENMMITPVGIASYPWVNEPDYKFDKLGLYQIKLIVAKDKAKTMINQLVKLNETQDGYSAEKSVWPFSDELDDQGVPTGNTVIKFKMKAKVIPKHGEPWEQKPLIKDKNGNRVLDTKLGSGSEVQVAFEPYPYSMSGKFGVSLRLKAVRILKLVEYTSGVDFGDVPQGYETKEETSDVPF